MKQLGIPFLTSLLLVLLTNSAPGQASADAAAGTVPVEEPAATGGPAPAVSSRANERHFELLTIGEVAYTNVWVHRQTNFNILIRHAGGIQTIKLTDLPQADLAALRPQLGDLANIEIKTDPELVSRFKEMQASEQYGGQLAEKLKEAEQMFKALLLPVIAVLVLLHLVSSFFIYALCKKTQTKTGVVVWLPLLNQTALLRAAGLPGVWALLGLMAPLIPVAVFSLQLVPPASLSGLVVVGISAAFSVAASIVWIVWCFKICIARQKSGWLGILLLIPGVNLLTFTYLAFAD
jgi:hypothetical protein